jgi:hypothetical protein
MKDRKHISLDDIGNKLPFTVPENYFEQFAAQIDGQISVKPVPVINLLRPWIYMAAMFIGLFLMGKVSLSVYQNNKIVNAENYEMYVMSQVDEDEMIYYYLTEENK